MKRSATWPLVWPILATIALPLIGAWFVWPDHLPPGFGIFPPEFVANPPGFSLLVFIAVAAVVLLVAALLLFPQWFGFKPATQPVPPTPRAGLPLWFWPGLVATLFFWWLMWTRVTPFGDLVYYAFTPMWWGFILVLDGIVYRLNDGRSLLATKPATFVISAIVSVGGWAYFEYLDYFALGNWYYPNTHLPGLSHAQVVVIFLAAYATVWPAVFEWYLLLNSFPRLVQRYAQGPKLPIPANLLLGVGFVLLAAVPFFPYPLFWALWIGPLAVIAGLLVRLGIWTPFASLARGNWSPMLLMALASLFNGFFWEVWNYGSAHPASLPATNPNYWIYDIPYVNVIHIYAEMPLLGFFGYLPFGLLVWVFFIWAGELFGFSPDLGLSRQMHPRVAAEETAVESA